MLLDSTWRMGQSTRRGPDHLKLEHFSEAFYYKDTNTALTGIRKQSIQDAENVFSAVVEDFMESKGYSYVTVLMKGAYIMQFIKTVLLA